MYKNYLLLAFILVVTACNSDVSNTNQLIIGKWKIYKIRMAGKDITKSSDPKNENGFEFKNTTTYQSFGNKGHQDGGAYNLSNRGKSLLLTSDKIENSSTAAAIELQGDTLNLEFHLEGNKKLEMALYRMK